MRALDLFCGGGGAALGMIQAGYEVTGVDINARNAKVYPGYFVHADVLEIPKDFVAQFDLVWASPPCQMFSPARNGATNPTINLIPETRALLEGRPRSVIENVPLAPIRADVILTGPTVGLMEIMRRRHFELSWWPGLLPKPVAKHPTGKFITVTKAGDGGSGSRKRHRGMYGAVFPREDAHRAMGIPRSFTRYQLGEAVPPAYAQFIAERAWP